MGQENDLEWIGEVSEALKRCSGRSATGPDQVPYGVWKGIYLVNPNLLPTFVKDMLTWEIHPPMLKELIGVILPKPNKSDYTDCASFRVIALMQMSSKIVERVVNNRLLTIAYTGGFYCIQQTGTLPHRSTVDPAVSLQHWIKEAQFAKKQVSSLILDVKGGFDNIYHRKLIERISENDKVPEYLEHWIQNFIMTRNITLAYPGSPRRTHAVNRGIPQGSPLSPLLFVIYVKLLDLAGESSELFTTSFVDDFQMTVASNSWERNARMLEEKAAEIMAMAQPLGLSFSIAKTELMHRRKKQEKGARSEASVIVQSHVIKLAGLVVKWLGYWLADNRETATHFTKRLCLAQGAFWRFQRLSLPAKGLSPYGARRLAKRILLPILLYGAEFLMPSKTIMNKMQKLWNRVMRWITNAFYATNISVLWSEACLAPMALYTEQIRLMAAVRIVTAIPENNVATAMLPQSFPIKGDFRIATNWRAPFDRNKEGMRRKVWSFKCNTMAQVRLPIDEVAARATEIFLTGPIPMQLTRLLRVTHVYAKRHFKAKETVQKNRHKKWKDEPHPPYCKYRPPYRECWNFMTFPKFAAGRIHQMRANKSYLKAQTDWSNQDQDPKCPRCEEELETMSHVVKCPALKGARMSINPKALDIVSESPLWKWNKKAMELIRRFSSYIMENRINFPSRIDVFPFTWNAGLTS